MTLAREFRIPMFSTNFHNSHIFLVFQQNQQWLLLLLLSTVSLARNGPSCPPELLEEKDIIMPQPLLTARGTFCLVVLMRTIAVLWLLWSTTLRCRIGSRTHLSQKQDISPPPPPLMMTGCLSLVAMNPQLRSPVLFTTLEARNG